MMWSDDGGACDSYRHPSSTNWGSTYCHQQAKQHSGATFSIWIRPIDNLGTPSDVVGYSFPCGTTCGVWSTTPNSQIFAHELGHSMCLPHSSGGLMVAIVPPNVKATCGNISGVLNAHTLPFWRCCSTTASGSGSNGSSAHQKNLPSQASAGPGMQYPN